MPAETQIPHLSDNSWSEDSCPSIAVAHIPTQEELINDARLLLPLLNTNLSKQFEQMGCPQGYGDLSLFPHFDP